MPIYLCLLAALLSAGGWLVSSARGQSADDCEFLRDRIAHAKEGAVVRVPPGTFTCRTPLVLDRDGLTLEGSGREESTLRLADGANAPLLVIGAVATPPAPVHSVTVRALSLDGNREKQSIECWGGPCDGGGTSFIRNNGLTVRNAHDARVENVRAYHARSGGLVTERGTRRLVVENFEAFENYFDGLAGYETEGSVFRDLYLHHNYYAGISIDLHFSRNRFERARLLANGDVGVYARWGEANEFTELTVEQSGSHGVYLAPDRCANRFYFERVRLIGNQGFGFWLDDAACTGTQLRDVELAGNAAGCLFLPEGADLARDGVRCR